MNSKGFSLIELIVAIVIIGIGIASFALLMNKSTTNSIDPMVRQQAHAVARAYLEEVLLKPFCDPDLTSDCPADCAAGNTCSDASCTENTGGTETRPTFDDVCDYTGLPDTTIRDQDGTAVAALNNYRVNVTVIDDVGADLNGLTGAASQSLRIDVNVTHTANPNVDVTVTGYRTNF
jgi:MSHA pilin protein MshD